MRLIVILDDDAATLKLNKALANKAAKATGIEFEIITFTNPVAAKAALDEMDFSQYEDGVMVISDNQMKVDENAELDIKGIEFLSEIKDRYPGVIMERYNISSDYTTPEKIAEAEQKSANAVILVKGQKPTEYINAFKDGHARLDISQDVSITPAREAKRQQTDPDTPEAGRAARVKRNKD